MIFHFAATTRFNEKFKTSILLNVRGVREMIKLACECKNLKLFCHLSTAFVHLSEKILFDKFYDSPADPCEVIEIAEKFNEEEVEGIFSKYLSKAIPSSYTFTKEVAEALLIKARNEFQLPLIVCRPSIVLPTYINPISGWIDNTNGFCGLAILTGSGLLRIFKRNTIAVFYITSVDSSINEIFLSAWKFLLDGRYAFYI